MKNLMERIVGKNYRGLESIKYKGKRLYLAKSVCRVLGLRNTSVAVKGNRARIGYFGIDKCDIYKPGGHRNSPLYITEHGVWKLILKSRKPAASAIKRMLSEKVLVEIMKTGSYKGNTKN